MTGWGRCLESGANLKRPADVAYIEQPPMQLGPAMDKRNSEKANTYGFGSVNVSGVISTHDCYG